METKDAVQKSPEGTDPRSRKVPLPIKLGYTVGSIGDSAAYNFVISFLSFFMTTVAGVSPAVSGTIIAVAIVWNAISDPVIGLMIDNSKGRKGRRRPFILYSLVPMSAGLMLLFLNVDLGQTQKNLFFLILALIFWTGYSAFNIPFYAMGSVITTDDKERIKISGWREAMAFVGVFVGTSVPTFLVGKLAERSLSSTTSWAIAAAVVAVITFVTIFIMWRSTKGWEPIEAEPAAGTKKSVREMFGGVVSLLRNRSYIVIILSALFCNVFMTLFNASVLYYTTYVMGVSEDRAAILFTVMTICSIAFIPIITWLALRVDKRTVYVSGIAFSGVIMIAAKFIGIPGLGWAIAYVIAVGVGTAAYWLFIFNFLYDVVDIDLLQTGKSQDGIIMSFYSLLLKLGGAVASLVLGLLMQIGGFDPEAPEQTERTIDTVESLFTIYPGVFFLLAGLVMLANPLTKPVMVRIHALIARKSEGDDITKQEIADAIKPEVTR